LYNTLNKVTFFKFDDVIAADDEDDDDDDDVEYENDSSNVESLLA